jgi:hypothetical protein
VKDRRPVGAALVAVIAALVIVAIAAGDGHEDHGTTDQRAAVAELPPADVATEATTATTASTATTTTTTTTTATPVLVAMAPCAVNGSVDPYFVVCGPASFKTGDRGTFELVARGHIRDDCGSPSVDWGDGSGNVMCRMVCDAYPADERSIERKLQHAYSDPGAYTVRFALQGCGPDLAPQAEITMEVTVY